jgi:hypothetical protein
MSDKVKFYLKKTTSNKVIIHSICRSTRSQKFLIPRHLRDPSKHPEAIAKKAKDSSFLAKLHLDHTLRGKEVYFYINPKNGRFWMNGIELEATSPLKVSKQPSGEFIKLMIILFIVISNLLIHFLLVSQIS